MPKKVKSFIIVALLMVSSLLLFNHKVEAASYPIVMASDVYVSVGEDAYIVYQYMPAFNNERLSIDLYDSSNRVVASISKSFNNAYASSIQYYTVKWDTKGISAGTYKAVVTKEFYSYYRWNTAPSTSTSYIYVVDDLQGASGNNLYTGTDTDFTCVQSGVQTAETNTLCNALSAWKSTSFGNYTVQLKEMYLGSSAAEKVAQENMYNGDAPIGMQWYLMVFDITNNCSQTLEASDILKQNAVYKYTGSRMTVGKTATMNDEKGVFDVIIEPGETTEVWMGICVPVCQQVPYLKINSTYLNINPAYASSRNVSTHNIVKDNGISATCVSDGLSEGEHCILCNKVIKEQKVIKATGHSWDNGKITKKATAIKTGIRTYTCSICNETRTEVIPALGVPKKDCEIEAANGVIYKVTKSGKSGGTVEFKKISSVQKAIVVPETVKIDGITYKVTSIAANAYKGNKKITKVTIGKNISKIGKNAFNGCTRLKSITVKTTKLTVKNVGSNAFKNINKNATIKVPKNKLKAYKNVFNKRGITGKNQKIKK